MLEVPSRARERLRELLDRALEDHPRIDAVPSFGFRIVHDEREGSADLGLVLDEPRRTDEVVLHEGQPVLIVDTAIAELLTGLTLEVEESSAGVQLELREGRGATDAAS